MKIFGLQFGHDENRSEQAEQYVESQWQSGLTRHYCAEEVANSIQQHTGVKLSPDKAVEVVEKVRARHGWERREYSSYFPPDDEE